MGSQLFFLSLADIFSVYPTISKDLITKRKKTWQVFLPSDADWQDKMYYRLLDVQRRVNDALESGIELEDIIKRKAKPVFDPDHISLKLSPSTSPEGLRNDKPKITCGKYYNTISRKKSPLLLEHISKASKLLKKPPVYVEFDNECEMRKVYSLIYDVFRYKMVLSNVLNEVSFYTIFPQCKGDENRTMLLFYELLDRNFQMRKPEDHNLQTRLYKNSEIIDISENLWQLHIKLSASLSKMRIKYGAQKLSKLLPIHLQNEKVAIAASNPVVTGWINPFLIRNKDSAESLFAQMGFVLKHEDQDDAFILEKREYKWDTICPLFLSCNPEDRNTFTKSDVMQKYYFIMQDRTFALGPAVMANLLDYFELDGDILQTHISSPRATAYLAALLYSVNRVNNFYVYGAGVNIKEYRKYMELLGISNIRIFAEPFTSFPLESKRFNLVVGVFANPPNSYSAISDPIDLICSRGGDLNMLEVLTESEISADGKMRVALILEEQMSTLQMAMSRSHTQFLLYQTHSIVSTENQDMANNCVNLVNKISLEKHRIAFREKKRLEALAEAEAANIPSAAMGSVSPRKKGVQPAYDEKTKTYPHQDSTHAIRCKSVSNNDNENNVVLPEVDEFVFESLPNICKNKDNCIQSHPNGCFFSLIKRKKITHLNAKYLIQMAETRGLFGKASENKSSKHKIVKEPDIKIEKTEGIQQNQTDKSNKGKSVDNLINRLLSHTNSSYNRVNVDKRVLTTPITFNYKNRKCLRHLKLYTEKCHPEGNYKSLWHFAFKMVMENYRNDCAENNRKLKNLRLPYPVHVIKI